MYNIPSVFDNNFTITQFFGQNDVVDYRPFGMVGHNGVDFIPQGSQSWNVKSVSDGLVINASFDTGGFGNMVEILSDGKKWIYAHLNNYHVQRGQRVTKGQVIGVMGNTGNSKGAHLHLGLKLTDSNGNSLNKINGYFGAIDPLPYLVETEQPKEGYVIRQPNQWISFILKENGYLDFANPALWQEFAEINGYSDYNTFNGDTKTFGQLIKLPSKDFRLPEPPKAETPRAEMPIPVAPKTEFTDPKIEKILQEITILQAQLENSKKNVSTKENPEKAKLIEKPIEKEKGYLVELLKRSTQDASRYTTSVLFLGSLLLWLANFFDIDSEQVFALVEYLVDNQTALLGLITILFPTLGFLSKKKYE